MCPTTANAFIPSLIQINANQNSDAILWIVDYIVRIIGTVDNSNDQQRSKSMIASPSEIGVEEIVVNSVLWLKLFIEAIGALVIGIGMILAGFRFIRGAFPPAARDFIDVRLTLARFLAIALEFQLGADILSTAVAPSWEAIGKLAAIAVIRTALNYFLSRDMQEERIGGAPPQNFAVVPQSRE